MPPGRSGQEWRAGEEDLSAATPDLLQELDGVLSGMARTLGLLAAVGGSLLLAWA